MKRSFLILFACALLQLSFISWGELQGGDYNGWIVKDGFGTLYFYNGCYVCPLSIKLKNKLADYVNQSVTLHIDESTQFVRPGEERIDSARFIAFVAPDSSLNTNLSLTLNLAQADDSGSVAFSFSMKNTGSIATSIYPAQLTFIITKQINSDKNPDDIFSVSDDLSDIVFDRRFNYYFGVKDWTNGDQIIRAESETFYKKVEVLSGCSYDETVKYKLKDGVYYVWAGYGDSNFSKPPSHRPSNGVKFQIINGNFFRLW